MLIVNWKEVEKELRQTFDIETSRVFGIVSFFRCWRFWEWVRIECQHCGDLQDVTILQDKPVLNDVCVECKKPMEDPIWVEAVLGAAHQNGLLGVKALLGG